MGNYRNMDPKNLGFEDLKYSYTNRWKVYGQITGGPIVDVLNYTGQKGLYNFYDKELNSFIMKRRKEYEEQTGKSLKGEGAEVSIQRAKIDKESTQQFLESMKSEADWLPDGNMNIAKAAVIATNLAPNTLVEAYDNYGDHFEKEMRKEFLDLIAKMDQGYSYLKDVIARQKEVVAGKHEKDPKFQSRLFDSILNNAEGAIYAAEEIPFINYYKGAHYVRENLSAITANFQDNGAVRKEPVSPDKMEAANLKYPLSGMLDAMDGYQRSLVDMHKDFDNGLHPMDGSAQTDLKILSSRQEKIKKQADSFMEALNKASQYDRQDSDEILEGIFGGREGGMKDSTTGSRGFESQLVSLRNSVRDSARDFNFRKIETDMERFSRLTLDMDSGRHWYSRSSAESTELKAAMKDVNDFFRKFKSRSNLGEKTYKPELTEADKEKLKGLYERAQEKARNYITMCENKGYGKDPASSMHTRLQAARGILNLTNPESDNNLFRFLDECKPEKFYDKETMNQYIAENNKVNKYLKTNVGKIDQGHIGSKDGPLNERGVQCIVDKPEHITVKDLEKIIKNRGAEGANVDQDKRLEQKKEKVLAAKMKEQKKKEKALAGKKKQQDKSIDPMAVGV